MKKFLIVMAICFVAMTSAVCALDYDDSKIQGLNITTDVDGALKASQSENKTVVMIFDQDSCAYCDMLKKDVLSNGDVQKELNGKYIVLLADINKNPDVAKKHNVFGTPTVVFLDPSGKEIHKIEGYVNSNDFLKELKEI